MRSDVNFYRATLAQLAMNLNFHVKGSNVADAKQTFFHAADRDAGDNVLVDTWHSSCTDFEERFHETTF